MNQKMLNQKIDDIDKLLDSDENIDSFINSIEEIDAPLGLENQIKNYIIEKEQNKIINIRKTNVTFYQYIKVAVVAIVCVCVVESYCTMVSDDIYTLDTNKQNSISSSISKIRNTFVNISIEPDSLHNYANAIIKK